MGKAKALRERLFENFKTYWRIQKWGDLVFFIDERINLQLPWYECGDHTLLDGVKVEVVETNKADSRSIITIDVGVDSYYFIYRIAEYVKVNKVNSSCQIKIFYTRDKDLGLHGVFAFIKPQEVEKVEGDILEIEYKDCLCEDTITYYYKDGLLEARYKSDLEPVKEVFYFSVP